jgi:hypothetical protein
VCGDQAASEHEQLASADIPVTLEKIYWLQVDTWVSVASQQIVFPAILGLAHIAQCNEIRKPGLMASSTTGLSPSPSDAWRTA